MNLSCRLTPCRYQDIPNEMSPQEVEEQLSLRTLRQCKWKMQATCAATGEGLFDGLEWISSQVEMT